MAVQTATRPQPTLFLLVLVSMAQPIGMNMYIPAIADMRVDLATSAAAVQLTLSLYLAATAVGQIVIGPASDLYGRRPVLLAGMGVFIAGSLICANAPDIGTLLFGRVVQAFGGCAGLSLSRAMVRDIWGARSAASMIGYVTMGMAVAPLITPVIGGLVHERWGWPVIFDLIAAFGAFVLLVAWLRLGETHNEHGEHGTGFRNWSIEARRLLGIGDFWVFAGVASLMSSLFFAFISGGSVVAQEVFGLSAVGFGIYFVIITLGYVTGNFLAGRFSSRVGLVRMIRIGTIVAGGGVALTAALFAFGAEQAVALYLPMFFVGLGNGIALPSSLAGAVSVRPELAGTASGLAGAFQVGGGAIVAVIVGVLLDLEGAVNQTVWPVLVPMIASALACVALAVRADDERLR